MRCEDYKQYSVLCQSCDYPTDIKCMKKVPKETADSSLNNQTCSYCGKPCNPPVNGEYIAVSSQKRIMCRTCKVTCENA